MIDIIVNIVEDTKNINANTLVRGSFWYGVTYTFLTYGISYLIFALVPLPVTSFIYMFIIGFIIGIIVLGIVFADIDYINKENEDMKQIEEVSEDSIPVIPYKIKLFIYGLNITILSFVFILILLLI